MSISRFDKFNYVLDEYMPQSGEGDTVASQIATAVAKIAYRWFNDGDTVSSKWMVHDASAEGAVSQYANWLYNNVPESRKIFSPWLDKFNHGSVSRNEYENFLYDMCLNLLNPDFLDGYSTEPKRDSIYNSKKYEDGVFLGEEEYEDGMEEDDW